MTTIYFVSKYVHIYLPFHLHKGLGSTCLSNMWHSDIKVELEDNLQRAGSQRRRDHPRMVSSLDPGSWQSTGPEGKIITDFTYIPDIKNSLEVSKRVSNTIILFSLAICKTCKCKEVHSLTESFNLHEMLKVLEAYLHNVFHPVYSLVWRMILIKELTCLNVQE